MKKVIFICTGNTCRSPMAEAIFKTFPLTCETKSCGLFADNSPYCEKSVLALSDIGIKLEGFSKQFTPTDLDADLYFCMSNSHKNALLSVGISEDKIHVLDVSDPFGCDLDTYCACRDEIFAKLKKFNLRFRPADINDMGGIAEVEKVCFSMPWSENALTESFNSGADFWVAEQDGNICGYVGMTSVIDEGYITNVAVLPDFRGFGVAKRLLNMLIEHIKQKQFSFVTLEVRESNKGAISLYEGLGFSFVGKRKGFYKEPKEDAILMTKVIKIENTQH